MLPDVQSSQGRPEDAPADGPTRLVQTHPRRDREEARPDRLAANPTHFGDRPEGRRVAEVKENRLKI